MTSKRARSRFDEGATSYCRGMAGNAGFQVDRIGRWGEESEFKVERDRTIAYANAMTTDPHTITDEQVADLARRFGDDGVIELTLTFGKRCTRLHDVRKAIDRQIGIAVQAR